MQPVTQKRLIIRRILWVAVLGAMVLIFGFSAQTGEKSGALSEKIARFVLSIVRPDFASLPGDEQWRVFSACQVLVRKTAHFMEYAFLALTLCMLLYTYSLPKRAVISWVLATLYAITDEVHQVFVGERTGAVLDVVIDSGGALFGMLIAVVILRWRQKYKNKNKRNPEEME